jgi:tripartite-type tricarboxylate transporter receptor subunit TctC
MKRKLALLLAALFLTYAGMLDCAAAQAWPNKPVRIVNTFAPGGSADYLARIVGDHLTRAFGQQFFIETRSGAGGAIGVAFVANSPPDGYNFAITTMSLLVIIPMTNPNSGYHPTKGLTNVAHIGGSPIVLVVNPSRGLKTRTIQEFVELAKKSPNPLTYSTSGLGSNGQLVAETFAARIGAKFEHIPYKGASQSLADLVGGHVDFSAQTLSSSSAMIRAGTLLPLVIGSGERLAEYSDVPTFRESGYDMVGANWFSLSAPANLPKDILDKVNAEIVRLVSTPEVAQRLRRDGLVPETFTPTQFAKFIEAETEFWRPAIERSGLIKTK